MYKKLPYWSPFSKGSTRNEVKREGLSRKLSSPKAFSIIEILVGIFIFSLWLVSVYAVLTSTLKLNDYNKNYIIATNLAREQLELVRNIRDSNYKQIKKYNQINPSNSDYNSVFAEWKYYKIENDYSSTATFPIAVEDITLWFWEWQAELTGKMSDYKLYLDTDKRYTFDSVGNQETVFYRYISTHKVEDANGVINNALKVKSKVIWFQRGYHEFEVNTVIADWKRL
jgi:Tfp pilus assembly protein PilV